MGTAQSGFPPFPLTTVPHLLPSLHRPIRLLPFSCSQRLKLLVHFIRVSFRKHTFYSPSRSPFPTFPVLSNFESLPGKAGGLP